MASFLRYVLVALALVLSILTPGCSSDDDSPTDPGQVDHLSAITLGGDHGTPLQRIQLTGITGDVGDYQIEVVDPDGTARSWAPITTPSTSRSSEVVKRSTLARVCLRVYSSGTRASCVFGTSNE